MKWSKKNKKWCINCQKRFKTRTNTYFCSDLCKADYTNWLSGISDVHDA